MIRRSRRTTTSYQRCQNAATTKSELYFACLPSSHIFYVPQKRSFGSKGSDSGSKGRGKLRTPTLKTTPTWERAAVRVKNADAEVGNPYMKTIRDIHDPAMHIKTIEDELKGTIGQALGKQGRKIYRFLTLMQESYDEYALAMEQVEGERQQQLQEGEAGFSQTSGHNGIENCPSMARVREAAVKFNLYRKEAVTARWELQVHRQAAGFIINNHNYVASHYPIPEKLPFDDNGDFIPQNSEKKEPFNKFGDQLDWWQRIGRWK